MGGESEKPNKTTEPDMEPRGDFLEEQKQRAWMLWNRANDRLNLVDKLKWAKEYAEQRPLVALFALIALAMCSIPVMAFLFFAICTVVFTFTGFLFVEGALLTMATVMLAAAMCVIGFLSLGLTVCVILAVLMVTGSRRFVSLVRTQVSEHQMPCWDLRVYVNALRAWVQQGGWRQGGRDASPAAKSDVGGAGQVAELRDQVPQENLGTKEE